MILRSDKKEESRNLELEKFSGAYGFVIKPDEKTQRIAELLAQKIAPNAEFHVKVPHITLYHAKFENLPIEIVKSTLNKLKEFEGTKLSLEQLQVFGGKFMFWNVKKTDTLSLMHKYAMEAASFLDQKAVADAVETGLNLDSQEIEYIKRFGYPLALEKYLPHITLAYDKEGLKLPEEITSKSQSVTVDKVLFCEIGIYGSVEDVII